MFLCQQKMCPPYKRSTLICVSTFHILNIKYIKKFGALSATQKNRDSSIGVELNNPFLYSAIYRQQAVFTNQMYYIMKQLRTEHTKWGAW